MTDQAEPRTGATDLPGAGERSGFPPPTGAPHRGGPEARGRSVPARWIAAVAAVVVLAATWLAGGFERASDRLARLPVGTEVDLGPMSIAVDRALARENSPGSWSVYVFARCRNNTDEPLDSSRDRLVRNGFSMQHPADRRVTADATLFFGPGETIGNATVLNPGMPVVPCTLVFDPEAFPATDFVSVGASVLEWIDASPTGEGQLVWSAARTAYRFEVPVVTQPEG